MQRLGVLAFTLLVSAASLADDAADAAAKMHECFAVFIEKDVMQVAHEIYATPVQVGGVPHRIYADPAVRKSLYILQKRENVWRTVAFNVHDADAVSTCNKDMA